MLRQALCALLLLCLVLGAVPGARAQTAAPAGLLAVPPVARVTDQTGTLSAAQVQRLNQLLQSFEARKGSQIAVLVVASTQPETLEQYGIRVASQWQLGRKGVDDGALLLVAKNDHTVRIEVGYGLEGALTDVVSARIIREIIVPKFRQGDFGGGISDGVTRMIGVIDGEPLPAPPPSPQSQKRRVGQYLPVLFFLALVAGNILRSMFGRLPGALVVGAVVAGLAWSLAGALAIAAVAGLLGFAITFFASGGGGFWGGGFGGFGGGGFGGGGLGGGGFGGGGGRFGGGGASGRW